MSTTSAAQIEANRANAQKSTGPVTDAGKAASSRNATSHGLTAKEIFVLPGEESEYLALQEDLTNLYNPQNQAEGVFFKILIHSAWNLRRCRHLDASLQFEANQRGIADALLDPELARIAERIARHLRAAERSHSKALAELRKLQTERDYRATYNEANGSKNHQRSLAVDTKTIVAGIDRHLKSHADTENLKIRTRYAPGMPAVFDNEDGTYTARGPNGTSTIRFDGPMIVDVPQMANSDQAYVNRAAA